MFLKEYADNLKWNFKFYKIILFTMEFFPNGNFKKNIFFIYFQLFTREEGAKLFYSVFKTFLYFLTLIKNIKAESVSFSPTDFLSRGLNIPDNNLKNDLDNLKVLLRKKFF